MATETELFYAGIIVINGLVAAFTICYQFRRLKIEEARSQTFKEQRDNLQDYYDARLGVEKAKLEVERKKLAARNGETPDTKTFLLKGGTEKEERNDLEERLKMLERDDDRGWEK